LVVSSQAGGSAEEVQALAKLGEQAEQALGAGCGLLRFPEALEAHFQAWGAARRWRVIVAFAVAAIVLYLGMLLPDWLLSPDVFLQAVAWRVGGFAIAVCLALALARRIREPERREWMVAAVAAWSAVVTAMILTHSEGRWALARIAELNLVVVFTCAFARFWPAMALCAVCMMVHMLLMAMMPDFTGVLPVNASVLLASTILFSLYANYKLEHDERMAYLLDLRERMLDEALRAAHQQLAHQVTTDPLTDLANRRYFDSYLDDYWRRAQEQGQAVSLLMIDVDHFKRYNDHYGHQAGDRCLKVVSEALQGCLRRTGDLVARIGGEEFAVVMPEADEQAARSAAERVRAAVEAQGLPHLASTCASVVTVSVGVATVRPDAQLAPQVLLHDADDALYGAKATGRNRIQAALAPLRMAS